MTRDKGIFQKGSERQGMNINPPVTKTLPPTPNSWTDYTSRVKGRLPADTKLSKKEISEMMNAYINGISVEKYLEGRG